MRPKALRWQKKVPTGPSAALTMQKFTKGAMWSKTSSALPRPSDASQLATKRPIPALLDSLVWSRFSLPAGDCKQALALQLRFLKGSESMGNHDSNIVDACCVD